jgi:hypothetical protein
MDENKSGNSGGETTFDALIEKMKHDVSLDENQGAPAEHVSRLAHILEAAVREVADAGEGVATRLHTETEKMRAQMKSHPVATISSAFAAGYFVGKAIAGRARK